VLVQFLVLSRWGRLYDLFGNRIILQLTGFTIPILWIVSANFYYLLAVQALSGLVWSGFSLSASNSVYDLTSCNKRAGLIEMYGVLAAVYVFGGASLGQADLWGLLVQRDRSTAGGTNLSSKASFFAPHDQMANQRPDLRGEVSSPLKRASYSRLPSLSIRIALP
jgi:MFS family permease